MRRVRPVRWGGGSATARAALVVGLLVTALVAGVVFTQGRGSAREMAGLAASDYADALKQRLGLANAYLRATAGRLRGSEPPTREQFDAFATSLGPQPVVDALLWLPVVTGGERAAFERVFLGPDGLEIAQLRPDGSRAASDARALHQPVAYFAGSEKLAFLQGLDFLSHEKLLNAATRASSTGQSSLSQVVTVDEMRFVILLMPVEPGRQATAGEQPLVGAVLGLDSLLARARARTSVAQARLVTDISEPERPERIVGPDGVDEALPRDPVTARISLAGRVWEVQIAPSYADVYKATFLTLLGGLVLTGLISLVADRGHHLLIATDLQREVDRQTAALQRSTAEFRALFEEGGAGKCELVPGSGHFRRVNLRLCEMLGIARPALEEMTLRDVLVAAGPQGADPAVDALLRGETDSYFAERRFRTSSEEELWGEVSATVLRDGKGRAVWIVAVVQDVTSRKEAEEARQLLVRELAHRVKNTLQLARSLADQTARYIKDLPSFMSLYQSRLSALSTAHDQLFKTNWAGADLADLVSATLTPYATAAGDRITIDVPAHRLSSAETQTVALLINELATNASKYGALGNDRGRIAIHAEIVPDTRDGQPSQTLLFNWEEDAGHPVKEPTRRGFGMTFLLRAVAHQHDGSAEVDWHGSGVRYRFLIPLHAADRADEADAA